jgi:hypothetical protein
VCGYFRRADEEYLRWAHSLVCYQHWLCLQRELVG